jgi:uncharacterized membrane protein HdeD (DUF308 family)
MSDRYAHLSEDLAQYWWTFALRGVLAILLGVIAFILPGVTLLALLSLFAAYLFLDGVFAIISAVRAMRARRSFWPLVLEGVTGIAAAAIIILMPALSLLALIYLSAGWAIVSGAFLLAGALRMSRETHGRWLLVLNGIFSVIWGVLVAIWPIAGAIVMTWWIGAYAIIFGALLVVLAFRLHRSHHPPAHAQPAGA